MGQKLEELWANSNFKKNLKVRYINWNHETKYFEIHSYSADKASIAGQLDNGEVITYPLLSQHWVIYEDHMEDLPKAV